MTMGVHDARATGEFETLEQEWVIPPGGVGDEDTGGDMDSTSDTSSGQTNMLSFNSFLGVLLLIHVV